MRLVDGNDISVFKNVTVMTSVIAIQVLIRRVRWLAPRPTFSSLITILLRFLLSFCRRALLSKLKTVGLIRVKGLSHYIFVSSLLIDLRNYISSIKHLLLIVERTPCLTRHN